MNNTIAILKSYLTSKYLIRFSSQEQLLTWQDQKVRNFLKVILPQSPFYREYYAGLKVEQWQTLPVINKSIMMDNFDHLNTVGIRKEEALAVAIAAENTRNFSSSLKDCTIGLSSGTSGNRGLFIVSQRERNIWAGTVLAKALPQFILFPQTIAFFLRANSNLYETVNKQRIQYAYFDLFEDVENHIKRLQSVNPTILVAPPSMLRLLAQAQSQGNLRIKPRKIISVAEVLDPIDEKFISQSFEQKVHQLYQCTEGFLGSTCEYGNLHLNEDLVVIQKEYIDKEQGKFMPIITDFTRQAQPIIRYRLDDILTECKTPCPCGSVLRPVASIEGRKDDIFWLFSQTKEKLIPVFPDFIRRAIITASEDLQEYRVVQESMNSITVFLKSSVDCRIAIQKKVTENLERLWRKLGCQAPLLTYQDYPMRKTHHQKMRRVQREFTPDNLDSLEFKV